jgi:hypothetical protein
MAVSLQVPLGLVSRAIAVNATTPDPGVVGALAWSTSAGTVLVWNGTNWVVTSTATGLTSAQVLARASGA